MSLLQINTAIPLAEPLLEQHERMNDEYDDNDDDNDYEVIRDGLSRNETKSRTKFILLGAVTGFFIQVISLGAYACLLTNFNGLSWIGADGKQEGGVLSMEGFFQQTTADDGDFVDGNSEGYFGKRAVLYTVLSVLTQVDLVVYVLIWVAFTCTMTRNGMACIRSQFFSSSSSSSSSSSLGKKSSGTVVHRRYVFVLGVCFLVGIVLGAFAAWSAVDIYLGFPIPFEPILLTVAIDLALCYLMIWCFDMGGRKREQRRRTKGQQQKGVYYDEDNADDEQEIRFEYHGEEDTDDDDDRKPSMCC